MAGAARGRAVRQAAGEGTFAQQLFGPLPGRYDVLQEVLSFGQNARWRRAAVDRVVAADPGLVLDVATGTAGVAIQVARRCRARVVGVDVTPAMLRRGSANVAASRLGARVALAAGRAQRLPFPDRTFDALTFTYLLRYVPDPQATLAELARVLRPGGVMASLEFYVPPAPLPRWAWWLYTRGVLPLAGGALGGSGWLRVGRFLGPNISAHYAGLPLDATVAAWQRAGFRGVEHRIMSLGGGLVMWGVRDDG